MPIVSFAQNFEDVLLWRALGDVEEGCYLDIGAQDPVVDSVSLAFYNAGWRGVHVEASPAYAQLLRTSRPDETVVEAAVSDATGPITFFSCENSGISTGVSDVANSHRDHGYDFSEINVPTVTLEHILNTINREIHWLKVDVEGMEPDVLRSWGSSQVRPWILLIESTAPLTQTPTENLWISEVVNRGYDEVFFDGLNRFFVHTSHKDLGERFSAPANFFDGFAIGKNHFAATFLCDDKNAEARRLDDAEAANDKAEIFRLHGAIHGLKVTESELRAILDQARAEREAIRLELVELHEQSRIAVETAWRERSAHENALRVEFMAREDRAAEALRYASASESTAKIELARSERELAGVQHAAAQERAELQLAAATEQLALQERVWRERLEFEDAIRREYQVKVENAAEMLRVAHAKHTELQTELARTQENLREALERSDRVESVLEKTHSLLEASKQLESTASARAERLERELRIEINEAVADGYRTASQLKSELSEAQSHFDRVTSQLDAADISIRRLLEERRRPWKLISSFLKFEVRSRNSGFIYHSPPSQPRLMSERTIDVSAGDPAVGRKMPISCQNERNPYLRAESLLELLAWDDSNFIRCAYVTILGRQPDEQGEDYYTALLRTGRSKLHILRQFRRSREGTDHDPGIAGLDRALRKAHREQIPLLGALVRLFTGGERDGIAFQRHRALMNEVARARIAQQGTQVELEAAIQAQKELAGLMTSYENMLLETRNEHKEFAGGVWQVLSNSEKMILEVRKDIAGASTTQSALAENVLRFMANFEDALKPRPEDRMAAETRLTPKAQKLYNSLVSR